MITLYGIPNCDTVRKARAWLDVHLLPYQFHDFKIRGVPPDRLAAWVQAVGYQALVNRRGSTWRQLGSAAQAAVVDDASAMALMLACPSVVKRPVLDVAGLVSVGFEPPRWQALMPALLSAV